MKKVKMVKDHHGAKAGDVVNFQDDAEADALVADGTAEAYAEDKHGKPGDDGRHGNPATPAEPATPAQPAHK